MIRKIGFVFMTMAIVFLSSTAFAADETESQNLPTRWNYAYEWVNLHLFTWKIESKVKVYDKYATERAQNIALAYNSSELDQVEPLSSRFVFCEKEISQILEQKNIANKIALLETVQNGTIERQRILSEVRVSLQNEEQKRITATLQEESVNNMKNTITAVRDKDAADKFSDKIVSAWRDPQNTIINDEKETRVYAVGTTENGTVDDGVIIDGGEAKISKDSGGNLKIEYAPGTGPSSVTADNGKKLWKIQMSDGSVVESYTSGGNVVIGQSTGVSSNIVVNTVAGGTGGTASVVVGNNSSSAGTVVVGGKSVVTSVDTSVSAGSNTVDNSTSSAGSSGSGQTVQTTP